MRTARHRKAGPLPGSGTKAKEAAIIAARAMAAPSRKAFSLAENAYIEIRNRILRGDLPVGATLSRRHLAAELKISVPPVVEALLHLERDGLVESRPRAGTRVRVPTCQDVEDRSLVREALETQAARLFAARATPAERKELQQMGLRVDQLYAAWEKNFNDRDFLFSVNTCHMELHLKIAECARCRPLRNAIEKEQVLIFNWLFDTAVKRRPLGSDFHASLTRSLATCTPDLAAAAMREHIQRGLKEVLENLSGLEPVKETSWRLRKEAAPRRA